MRTLDCVFAKWSKSTGYNRCMTVMCSGYQILHGWDMGVPGTWVRAGVGFDNYRGRITIKRDGLYFYSNRLLFIPDIGDAKLNTVKQRLLRVQARYWARSETLLQDTVTKHNCVQSVFEVCYVSTMSSLLYLRAGDELFTQATHVSQLSTVLPVYSYLDLFSIDLFSIP